MLEIFIVIAICRGIGKITRDKGQPSVPYQILGVVLWFGGEILGAIVAVVILSGSGATGDGADMCAPYLCALIGAACGAGIAFAVANALPDSRSQRDDDAYSGRRRDFDSGDRAGPWARDLPADADEKFGNRLNRPPHPYPPEGGKEALKRPWSDDPE